jgi:hypothetical protein
MTLPPDAAPISVEAVKQSLAEVSTDAPATFSDFRNQAEAERIELEGRRQFFKLRGYWSGWLIGWITALLVFQTLLTMAIGSKLLDFREYSWFLPMVVVQNFLQIVGMGVVIVRFLYPGATTQMK